MAMPQPQRSFSLTATLFCLCFAVVSAQVSHGAEDASVLIQSSLEGLARGELLHASQELEEEGVEEEQLGESGLMPAPGSHHGKAEAKRPAPQKQLSKKPQSAQRKPHSAPGPAKKVASKAKGQGTAKVASKAKGNLHTAKKPAQQGGAKHVAKKQEDKKKAAVQADRKVEEDVQVQEPAHPQDVRLVVAGPGGWNHVSLKVPSGAHLAVAAWTAATNLGIARSDVRGLKHHGRTMNLTQTVLDSGLKDGDSLDMDM